VANTLALYDTATITAVKSFIVQAPGACIVKRFTRKYYIKLQRLGLHFQNVSDKENGFIRLKLGYHDTQHNGTQNNDTQHNGTQHNSTRHNGTRHNDIKQNDNKGLISNTHHK
jgi:hypothetical protein